MAIDNILEKTLKQSTHVDGQRTANRIDLGLEWHALIPPNPLYHSGRLKKLGDAIFWGYLDSGTDLITFHQEEIGVLYEDHVVPGLSDSGMFPRMRRITEHTYQGLKLPQLIADVLADKRWTQAKLAEVLEIPSPRISEYLSGKRKVNFDLVKRLHWLANVPATTLLNLQS